MICVRRGLGGQAIYFMSQTSLIVKMDRGSSMVQTRPATLSGEPALRSGGGDGLELPACDDAKVKAHCGDNATRSAQAAQQPQHCCHRFTHFQLKETALLIACGKPKS
jgi:hypothetical protein